MSEDQNQNSSPAKSSPADKSKAPASKAAKSKAGKKTEKKGKKEKPGFWSTENLLSLTFLVITIFMLRSSIASPYHVPTASMEPTIKVGDRLLAWKLAYELKVPFTDWVLINWGSPERGDIIVFKYPGNESIDYVKRVVAVAGDKVEVRDDILYVNDVEQPQESHDHDRSILDDINDIKEHNLLFRETLFGREHWVMQKNPAVAVSGMPDDEPPFEVPEDSVFVMGDNRDNSTDSRIWNEVHVDKIRGKALFVIWSVYTPNNSSWPSLRFGRFGSWLYD